MNGTTWSIEDRDLLRALWAANTPTPEIAAKLNRTEPGVIHKARDLKLPPRANANWPEEKDDILRAAFAAGESFREIGLKVGLTRNAAIGRAQRLGLTRIKPGLKVRAVEPEASEFALKVKPTATVMVFRPRTERADTLSPPLPGSKPRPWTERDVRGGPKLCCWPVDVEGADIQHSCCLPRELGTDPGSVRDFQAFAKQTGNTLLEHVQVEKEFTFYLQRK